MICPKCNKELDDNANFCPNCGEKIKISDNDCQKEIKTTLDENTPETDENTKKEIESTGNANTKINKKQIGIGIAIVCIVLIGGASAYHNSLPSTKYNRAEVAFEKGNYKKAVKYYQGAGDYEDSKTKLQLATQAYNYDEGVKYYEKGDFENAIKYLVLSSKYKNSSEMLISIGQQYVEDGDYANAVSIFEQATGGKSDKYYNYAKANLDFEDKKYEDAAKEFRKAGELFDSKDKFNESEYLFASKALTSNEYSKAASAFDEIKDYKDSKEKLNQANLMLAKTEMNNGNLNKAKELVEKVASGTNYNNINRDDILNKLNANSNWLSLCGKWTSTDGKMETNQNGSYGYSTGWHVDFEENDINIDVRCKINDDNTKKIIIKGSVPIFTEYSSISIGLKQDTIKIDADKDLSDFGTFYVNDYTSVTVSPSQIIVDYYKEDKSKDVYFTYTYSTKVYLTKKVSTY